MDSRSNASPRRRGRPGCAAVFALILFALLLVAGELALRTFLPIRYSMAIRYVDDGHVGWRLEPGHAYTLFDGGVCAINNLGFRGVRDTEVPKPDGIVRVVVLGGSATFCYEVDDADAWTALLEGKLRERYGNHIEVINAGVPGYDAFTSKMNYLYRVRPVEPDVVVVSHTWNDVKRFREIESGVYPDATIGPRHNLVRRLLRNLQLAWRVRALWWRLNGEPRRENTADEVPDAPAEIPDGGRAHRWARRNYDDLALLLAADGVMPVFASQAGLLAQENVSDPAVRAMVRNDYAYLSIEETLKQWRAMSGIIEASAHSHGVLFVDVYDEVPHDVGLFHDHVHLTGEGNRRVAEALFQGMAADSVVGAVLGGHRDDR